MQVVPSQEPEKDKKYEIIKGGSKDSIGENTSVLGVHFELYTNR